MVQTSIWQQIFNVPSQSSKSSHQKRIEDDKRARANRIQRKSPQQIRADNKRAIEGNSSGSGITSANQAGEDSLSGGEGSSDGDSGAVDGSVEDSSSSDGSSGRTSPLLEGSMTFEQLVQEICNGIDLIFVCKRSTVVVTDYESLYAEAKYLRDNYHTSVQAEDIALWQLEDGSYELEVSEYGFYNTVKVNYKNGTVTESYEDLVRVYGEVVAEYDDKTLDKSSAIMKAKAYLAAHVRDFDMSVKAKLLHDAEIDIGDIVTLENPMTMRDKYRKDTEGRDPEYFFVMGNSISWEGEGGIINDIELRYGAKSPERKDVPETGSPGYTSSSGVIDPAVQEVGQMAEEIKYGGSCQSHDCVKTAKVADCHGMSDFIACELKAKGIETKILQYATSMAGNHRSVKYKSTTGTWLRFPYRSFDVDKRFYDTDAVEQGKEVNKSC